ncbi:MAG: transposase domain-containing protein [bacterium]|nr:transposase domain-containing protein [bacterium]
MAKANGLEPYWYLRYLFTSLSYCTSELKPARILFSIF